MQAKKSVLMENMYDCEYSAFSIEMCGFLISHLHRLGHTLRALGDGRH